MTTGGTLSAGTSGVTAVNIGTLHLNGAGSFNGTLNGLLPNGGIINYQPGTNVVFGGLALPQQAGQNVKINGIDYLSTQVSGTSGTLRLQPVAH